MNGFQKCLCAASFASAAIIAAPVAAAPEAEDLLEQLAEPGRADWMELEQALERLWSQSGSASMDLLLERGNAAMAAHDARRAAGFYAALTDHAPDFAEGWNARGRAHFWLEEYSLSLSFTGQALALNPHHIDALARLAMLMERMGTPAEAEAAWAMVAGLSPNRPDAADALARLRRDKGAADL